MNTFKEHIIITEKWHDDIKIKQFGKSFRHTIYKNAAPKELAETMQNSQWDGVGLVSGSNWYTWTNNDGGAVYHQTIIDSGAIPKAKYHEFRFEVSGRGRSQIIKFHPDGGSGKTPTPKDRKEAVATINAIMSCRSLIVHAKKQHFADLFSPFGARLKQNDWNKVVPKNGITGN